MKINKNHQYVNNMKKKNQTNSFIETRCLNKKKSTFVSEISHELMNSSQSKDTKLSFQFI